MSKTIDLAATRREDAIIAQAEAILWKRLERHGRIDDARDAEQFFRVRLGGLPSEELHALWLDQHFRVIACDAIARGGRDRADVSLSVLLRRAVLRNARAVILAHQHPSGESRPSPADIAFTRRACEAMRMIEVEVLEHLVIGRDGASTILTSPTA